MRRCSPAGRPAAVRVLLPGLAPVCAAGETAARTGVCADDPPAAGNRIVCNPGNIADGLDVATRNVSVSVTTPTRFRPAVDARAEGASGIIVRLGHRMLGRRDGCEIPVMQSSSGR